MIIGKIINQLCVASLTISFTCFVCLYCDAIDVLYKFIFYIWHLCLMIMIFIIQMPRDKSHILLFKILFAVVVTTWHGNRIFMFVSYKGCCSVYNGMEE